jgi:sirohydrochlorin cobaltochelatase
MSVTQIPFSDAAVILAGHGLAADPDSEKRVRDEVSRLRQTGRFAEVREAFWKQPPLLKDVLTTVSVPRVFIVPMFMSEGYFSENVIPGELGFIAPSSNPVLLPSPPQEERGGERAPFPDSPPVPGAPARPWNRVRRRGSQCWFYCRPIGTHPLMTRVILERARQTITRHPFPRLPAWKELTLIIASHGTERDPASRQAPEAHAEIIRGMNLFGSVAALFLEEEPRLADFHRLAATRKVVVVPFFIGEGWHVRHDIPALLGEPEAEVRRRLESKQPPWRNPTEKHGKLVWYSPPAGTDPLVVEIICDRLESAAAWAELTDLKGGV